MKLGLVRHLLLLLLVIALPHAGYGQAGADRIVGSAQELNDALAAGATSIALRPGAYREIAITQQRPATVVTLKAADPAQPPLVHKLLVADAANLLFRNWRLLPHADEGMEGVLADVQRSRGIIFERMSFNMDVAPTERRWRGVTLLNVEGFALRDSTMAGLERGLQIERSRQVSVSHNLFTQMGLAAVNIVEGEGVEIESNRFTGLRGPPDATGTFVHVWTRGTTLPSRNLTIRNNVMIQDTQTAAQGVFLSNEARIPFENVLVADNIVVVGSPHAISVDRASNVKVLNNLVLDTADSTFNASVRLTRVTGAEVTNNLASAYGMFENQDVVRRRNVTIARLERRTRELFLARLQSGLSEKGEGRVHAQHRVTAAQRASGPRT